eukprot:GABV01001366.1.p1 GENE.GABV01001366.1~~GABV01001366.1.p1  ORF type:complete len:262 (+),score=85.68 GABV01001366.1:34-819(+)
MGYCPQVDPLLDLMTCEEHLQMFARLRGIPETHVALEVDRLLRRVDLIKYRGIVAGSLSGGNKRKLSLGLALVGQPMVVFLDEPSSGMDVMARRSMWDIIQAAARDHAIVLTSHSMEEIEALCSRATIMVRGELQCIGTLQHLKNKFGQGYNMEVKTDEDNVANVRQFVERELFEGAILDEHHGGQLHYRLPAQQQDISLASLFSQIEEKKKLLKIHDYSLSQSSLESIFVNIAKREEQIRERMEAGARPTAAGADPLQKV